MTTVLSLGGSIVAPEGPDPAFIKAFVGLVREHLGGDPARRLILVVGGGGPARLWQKAYREVVPAADAGAEAQDWIGIMATRLNAQLVKAVLGELCPQEVVVDPSGISVFMGRVLVASGWKPGFSTDFDAVLLAERFGASQIVNLSNIAKVYSDDPKTNPSARPVDRLSWGEMRAIVGDEWTPGKNTPFDPTAARAAAQSRIRVIFAEGRNLHNLSEILAGRDFVGTTIGPD
jgi:uridylate kinase